MAFSKQIPWNIRSFDLSSFLTRKTSEKVAALTTFWNVFSQVLLPELSAFYPKKFKYFCNLNGYSPPPPPPRARTPMTLPYITSLENMSGMFNTLQNCNCVQYLDSSVYKRYYMPARGYEFYLREFNSISNEWLQRTSEIWRWTREDKNHIHKRAWTNLTVLFLKCFLSKNWNQR